MPTAYEGKQPYIFVSYSHADKAQVMRYIEDLEKYGFRVWFDGGIEAGSEWPEYIANHLANSACVLAFISGNFVNSMNCRRELALAQELKKDQLNVYIEKVELSMGMRMQLGLSQAMFRDNFSDERQFVAELCKARLLARCRAAQTPPPKAQPHAEKKVPAANVQTPAQKPVEKAIPADNPLVKQCTLLGWVGAILELLYIPISFRVMSELSSMEIGGFEMFLYMIIPHTVIALINKILFSRHLKKMKRAGIDKEPLNDASVAVTFVLVLATLISVIGGASNLYYDLNYVVRLLISLGLNVVPFIIAGLISLFLSD